jgi:RecJ-like exonuclease
MKTTTLAFTALIFLPFANAEEKKPEPLKPPQPAVPATPAAPDPAKVFAPTAIEELKALKGKTVTLEAPIIKLGENKSGTVRYLNFTDNYRLSASLAFFANAGSGNFTKEKLVGFVGKKVRVTGELTEYNGSLQIKMTSLDQIKVIE